MANCNRSAACRATMLVVVMAIICGSASATSPFVCDVDQTASSSLINSIVSGCSQYVIGSSPTVLSSSSGACCSALKAPKALPCLCNASPGSSAAYFIPLINQQAVKSVMQTCGIQLPSGVSSCAGVKLGN